MVAAKKFRCPIIDVRVTGAHIEELCKAKATDSKAHLNEMIADKQKTLLLLVELREGLSYRDAAKVAGLSTTAAFMRVKSLRPWR